MRTVGLILKKTPKAPKPKKTVSKKDGVSNAKG